MKWVALAAAACLGALSLTACGATSAVSTPVAQAADKTASQGSEHVEYSGSIAVSGQNMTMTGSGDFQNDPQLGRASMTMKGAGQTISIDTVMKGWTIYLKSPLFAKGMPAGKSWLSIDMQTAGKKLGIDFSQFAQSPTGSLTALKSAGTVTKVGDETVGGVATTHYRATIDPAKMPNGAQLQKLAHVRYQPVDVWVGHDGLVRRMTMSFTATVSGNTTTMSMTMGLSNYGEQVDVQVPSADETIDMTKLGG